MQTEGDDHGHPVQKVTVEECFYFFLTFKDVANVLNLPRLIVAKEKIHKSLQPPLPHLPPHESTFQSYLLPLIN